MHHSLSSSPAILVCIRVEIEGEFVLKFALFYGNKSTIRQDLCQKEVDKHVFSAVNVFECIFVVACLHACVSVLCIHRGTQERVC